MYSKWGNLEPLRCSTEEAICKASFQGGRPPPTALPPCSSTTAAAKVMSSPFSPAFPKHHYKECLEPAKLTASVAACQRGIEDYQYAIHSLANVRCVVRTTPRSAVTPHIDVVRDFGGYGTDEMIFLGRRETIP